MTAIGKLLAERGVDRRMVTRIVGALDWPWQGIKTLLDLQIAVDAAGMTPETFKVAPFILLGLGRKSEQVLRELLIDAQNFAPYPYVCRFRDDMRRIWRAAAQRDSDEAPRIHWPEVPLGPGKGQFIEARQLRQLAADAKANRKWLAKQDQLDRRAWEIAGRPYR